MRESSATASRSKIRVIRIDVISGAKYPVGEFYTPEEAFEVTDDRNRKRRLLQDQGDIYCAYDDLGNELRGIEDLEA
jgi:hypothetical protein